MQGKANPYIILICVAVMVAILFIQAARKATQDADSAAHTSIQASRTRASLLNGSEESQLAESVVVTKPKVNSRVRSPLLITGKALGPWFFEASFPVRLLDEGDQVIATGVAQASGNWQTNGYVAFEATLEFPTQPTASDGVLIFQKSNPSGLPENDEQFAVPIVF